MSKVYKILANPNPLLRERSNEVPIEAILKPEIQNLIDSMIETMWRADGIGLAAVQIGVNLRVIIITRGTEAVPLINPVITHKSIRKNSMEEGCLSVPGFYGLVKRSKIVTVKAINRSGKEIKFKADGLESKIVQHEVDHINGKLFIDRAKNIFPVESPTAL